MRDPSELLRRHVELMAACTIWAVKADEAMKDGNRDLARRYLKRAESLPRCCERVRALVKPVRRAGFRSVVLDAARLIGQLVGVDAEVDVWNLWRMYRAPRQQCAQHPRPYGKHSPFYRARS